MLSCHCQLCVITLFFINVVSMILSQPHDSWQSADYLCVFKIHSVDKHLVCVSMCVLIFPQAMSFEAHSLTVPSVLWLGLLPSDLQRFGLNICHFLLPPPAPNWDYILVTFRLFVLVSVAVALTFFLQETASEGILAFKYMSP